MQTTNCSFSPVLDVLPGFCSETRGWVWKKLKSRAKAQKLVHFLKIWLFNVIQHLLNVKTLEFFCESRAYMCKIA